MFKVRNMRNGMKKGAIITALLLFFINCLVPVTMGATMTTLKVLEVQPGNHYQLTSSYTNVSNYNVQVTQMPMSQFISSVDGLNGKYDIIVIGNNSYNGPLAGNLLHYNIPNVCISPIITTITVVTTTKTTKYYHRSGNNHYVDTTIATTLVTTTTTTVNGSSSDNAVTSTNPTTVVTNANDTSRHTPTPDTVVTTNTTTNTSGPTTTYPTQTTVPVHYTAEGDHFSQMNNNNFTLPQGGTTDSYENYSPNDITSRRAALLAEFIQSGQLTVFADSIFTSSDLTNTILNNKFSTYRNNSTYPNFYSSTSIDINDLVSKYAAANKRPTLTITSSPLEYNGSNEQINKYMNFGFDASGKNPMVASLYIDIDGDGVFSDTEKTLDSGTITTNNPTDGHFSLNYRLPDSYTGMQPWKLVLEDSVTHAKSYNTGFSAYIGTPLNIRVLQLIPPGNLLNIKTGMQPPLIKDGEYNISVTVMNVADFDNNCPNQAPTTTTGVSAPTHLNTNYDMVIMGFADIYGSADLKQPKAIQELKDFIATGQSVMFTHDTMTFLTSGTTGWDYNLTKQFRDLIGQNIYNKDPLNATIAPLDLSSRLPYPSGSTKSYGFTRLTLDRANNGNQFSTATSAFKLNDGLITEYPYLLAPTLSVATTHHQYFQLDLEDPSIVPWFTLQGGAFNSLDGRNDYYTYSKGNITYSGTGHTAPNNVEEQKLFINTIIKAARGANHAPTVDIYDLNDNQKIYTNQTRLDFSFDASDLDLIKDSQLKASISITDNSTHITTPVTAFQVNAVQANLDSNNAFYVQNNSIVKISMPKTVPDTASNFTIKVTAQDSSLATGYKTITLYQVSPPSLSLSTTGNNFFLANDTGDITFNITPYNTPVQDMTNIQLVIDKDQTGICGVSADAAANNQDPNAITINLPDYVAGDVHHWTQQGFVMHAAFLKAPASGDLKLNYHLKYNTTLNGVTQSLPQIDQSIDFHVQSGEIHGDVKDVQGRSFENVLVTASNGTDTPVTTQTSNTGAYSFTNLKTGTYTITAAGRSGYNVTVKTGSATGLQLSNSATDNSSYQKEVDFLYGGTLMENISIVSLTDEVTTQCIPQGVAYAKIKFTLDRPVTTMSIDLNTTVNDAANIFPLANVTFKLNGIAYTGSCKIVGDKLTLLTPPDGLTLPTGSYELVLSFDLGTSVVVGDTVKMSIIDLITTEENVDVSDTVSPSANSSLFTNYSLPMAIVSPPYIL
ncbi:MAG: DUF5057 domain-containing protein [Desulfosporosinus sp.]|nr:DUF5057 domain-containing protein [Desulfosporosinus sp.]